MNPRPKHTSPYAEYGSDADYQVWCRGQGSAYSGDTYNVIYAHYRTANNGGVGMKPKYSGIPLTQAEHDTQHRYGHDALMPREWWDHQVRLHLERWAKCVASAA